MYITKKATILLFTITLLCFTVLNASFCFSSTVEATTRKQSFSETSFPALFKNSPQAKTKAKASISAFLTVPIKSFKIKNAEIEASKLAEIILKTAEKKDMNPYLIAAVVRAESSGRKEIVSRGCFGLMQIKWSVHKKWIPSSFPQVQSSKDLCGAENNILVGSSILRDAIRRTGSLDKALAKYKGGHSGKYIKKVRGYINEMER